MWIDVLVHIDTITHWAQRNISHIVWCAALQQVAEFEVCISWGQTRTVRLCRIRARRRQTRVKEASVILDRVTRRHWVQCVSPCAPEPQQSARLNALGTLPVCDPEKALKDIKEISRKRKWEEIPARSWAKHRNNIHIGGTVHCTWIYKIRHQWIIINI